MTAKISGFRTRAQLNLRAPKSVSHNITPEHGGVGVHYGGPTPNPAPSEHSMCESIWRSWQNYHMDGHGWVDIAYTAGFCNHGYVLAGRGYFTRTAANGTNDANQNYYAFVWVGGGNAIPNSTALNALEWLISDARKNGKAGLNVKPHSAFFATSCPGTYLKGAAAKWDGKATYSYYVPPKFPYELSDASKNHYVGQLQKKLNVSLKPAPHLAVDNDFGPKTIAAVKLWQHQHGLKEDGIVGKITWTSIFAKP